MAKRIKNVLRHQQNNELSFSLGCGKPQETFSISLKNFPGKKCPGWKF